MLDMHGKPVQIGSKVRVPERMSAKMGVPIGAYTATITEISADAKGTVLTVRSRQTHHDRSVRPAMVRRIRYKTVG